MTATRALLVFGLALQAQSAWACRLSIDPAWVPDGRIASMEIYLMHGAISGLQRLPPGWHVEINNDPSWRTIARGRALVGAAFLDSLNGLGMWLFQPEPGFTCGDLSKLAKPRISGRVYRDDRMHGFRLDSRLLKLEDDH